MVHGAGFRRYFQTLAQALVGICDLRMLQPPLDKPVKRITDLAALYAARHPEVSKVVCLAPAFDFAARWSARLGIEEMAQWKERGWLPVFHYGQQREARVGYGLFEDSLRYEAYPDVRQSCLVFHGLQDDVVPVEVSEEFARRHPDTARLLRMDSGHELIDVLEPMWEETWRFLSH